MLRILRASDFLIFPLPIDLDDALLLRLCVNNDCLSVTKFFPESDTKLLDLWEKYQKRECKNLFKNKVK